MNILLVEDNEQNSYLVRFLLETAGHTVVHLPTGRAAVEYCQEQAPGLVLMDIQMPEMDGYEAAGLIMATPRMRGVPIIAVTSYAMAGDRDRAMKLGFSGYIEKPINPETFVAEVNRFHDLSRPTP